MQNNLGKNIENNINRKLSVIVPVYNEEDSIRRLCELVEQNINKIIADKQISEYEVWFINDGSTDGTEKNILQEISRNQKIKLITFRRNFGKSRALQTGFCYARGDIILTMDADLQDDPCEIPRFINKIDEGYDLVSGWKAKRYDSLEKRLPSKFFNFIAAMFSGIKIHDFNCGFKAYRREVVESLNVYGEFHRYIPILAARNGFKVGEMTVRHHKRQFGHSKFGYERYLRGMFDAISSLFLLRFYDKPMYFFGKIGLVMFTVGFLICSWLTILWFSGQTIGHRPLLILGVLFILVGVQSFSLGLLANIIVDSVEKKNETAHIRKIVDKDDINGI